MTTQKKSGLNRIAEVRRHIRIIKEMVHPVVRLASPEWPPMHEFSHRSWASVPESAKLSMLQDMVDWTGVSNKDMAHILLGELDVGKLSAGQRDFLIRLAAPEPTLPERTDRVSLDDLKRLGNGRSGRSGGDSPDRGIER